MAHMINLNIPDGERYRALREVFEACSKGGGLMNVEVYEDGSIDFAFGDKRAHIEVDDPMNDVIRREWWNIQQH